MGLSWHNYQRVGAVLVDLTSYNQMIIPGLGPLDWRRGFAGVILALMQMWETDGPCVSKILGVVWTKITLAACSGGLLTLKNQDVVPLEPMDAETLMIHCFQCIQFVVMAICLIFTPLWPMYLFEICIVVALVVKESFVLFCKDLYSYRSVGVVNCTKIVSYWYGLRPFTISIILYILSQYFVLKYI